MSDPVALYDADLAVLPGSKATVDDLDWLRERGLADAIAGHAKAGKPVLGICGGLQILCRRIEDPVESGGGEVAGLGLLDADVAFAEQKTVRRWQPAAGRIRDPSRPAGPLRGGPLVHGRRAAARHRARRRLRRTGTACWTTTTSGRGWLTGVAAAAGRSGFVVADDTDVAARRDAQLDLAAELLASHPDLDAVLGLFDRLPPRPGIASWLRP